MNEKSMQLRFDRHGLGDVCHAALWLQLWRRRGYDITVQVESNKIPVWQMAGVEIVQGGDLPNHDYGYPAGFEDLSQPDWRCNKAAHGMMHGTMPRIGEPQELWGELAGVRLSCEPILTDQVRDEAETFLEGMPRPIICIHTKGTNWQSRKSLSTRTAFDAIVTLLRETGGSVISLDFDSREPIVAHSRCKGIIPSWGMLSIDRLCALYCLADLVIGVDSGPFHLASFTPVKALGVFREIHPVRCCIPSPNAAYMVSRQFNEHWDQRATDWRFIRYAGIDPTAHEIAAAAIDIISGGFSEETCSAVEVNDVAGRYLYRRVGHDERPMELRSDGTIGEGSAGCERRWTLRNVEGVPTLTIKGIVATCHLTQGDGIWKGRWISHEKMPIELIKTNEPISSTAIHLPSGPDIDLAQTRGDGMYWIVDDRIHESAIGLRDHEDWIRQYIPTGKDVVIVDVGAFVGTFTIWSAQRCKEVIAIEPQPLHFELLSRNCRLNAIENVRLLPIAVGNTERTVLMSEPDLAARVGEDFNAGNVQQRKLDDVLADEPRVDCIKIDVEGSEVRVLEGAVETLRRLRPRLLIEVHSHYPGCESNGDQIVAILTLIGYSCQRVWQNTPAYYYVLCEAKP